MMCTAKNCEYLNKIRFNPRDATKKFKIINTLCVAMIGSQLAIKSASGLIRTD